MHSRQVTISHLDTYFAWNVAHSPWCWRRDYPHTQWSRGSTWSHQRPWSGSHNCSRFQHCRSQRHTWQCTCSDRHEYPHTRDRHTCSRSLMLVQSLGSWVLSICHPLYRWRTLEYLLFTRIHVYQEVSANLTLLDVNSPRTASQRNATSWSTWVAEPALVCIVNKECQITKEIHMELFHTFI